jgi:hypothetical protein
MYSKVLGLIAFAALFSGCDSSLDAIDGHTLGEPKSVIFGTNESGHTMMVMSDLPYLCDAVRSADPPARADFWVLSTWTNVDADVPGKYVVDTYVAVTDNGVVHEYETRAGVLNIQKFSLDEIKAEVKFSFSTGDSISANIRGELCSSNLFVGLQTEERG